LTFEKHFLLMFTFQRQMNLWHFHLMSLELHVS